MGPLEQEVANLLEDPVKNTPYGIARRTGGPEASTEAFFSLTGDQRDEMFLLSSQALRTLSGGSPAT